MGATSLVTYTFDDLVKALNTVQPYDWAGFFRTRVFEVNPNVPQNGFTQGGYRLVYNDNEPEWLKKADSSRGVSFATSLGFSVKSDGSLDSVWWDSLAFKAGMTPDMQLQAVNDQTYTAAGLRETILAAENSKEPIKLLLKRGDEFVTVSLDYHGGMRYRALGESRGNARSSFCNTRAGKIEVNDRIGMSCLALVGSAALTGTPAAISSVDCPQRFLYLWT